MNIFVLDLNVKKCARAHVDAHVGKLLLEAAQMMSTAIHMHPPKRMPKQIYKSAHQNHPCTIWVRESLSNFRWLRDLCYELNEEGMHRGRKSHKSWDVISGLGDPSIPDKGLTPFAQAMPWIHQQEDPVEAYRSYYMTKEGMHKWTNRLPPKWFLNRLI